jgi:phosphoribosylaminoimidazolecarboxamide formyltransferase / IMP cyclohydrolase
VKIKRALISVSDKTGLIEFAKGLKDLGIEIVSTGGTRKFLEENKIYTRDISNFTGFPEILDGRVKTLHPKVHGALLAKRNNPDHLNQVKTHNIEFIDMVVVNLYPFKQMLKKENVKHEEMIENIDIGGPSMLRSAAKNYHDVIVLTDNNDYNLILNELKKEGDISLDMRLNLAAKVFVETSIYDHAISSYLNKNNNTSLLPNEISLRLTKNLDLRYGENPHQKAGYYKEENNNKFNWEQLGGKELSYNNILDIEAAWNLVSDFDDSTLAIIKHNNPCGITQDNDLAKAYTKAFAIDSASAFGGIIAINRKVTAECANEIVKNFTECVVAEGYEDKALEILSSKKNVRIIKVSGKSVDGLEFKKALGGFLVQEKDTRKIPETKIVTNLKPSASEIKSLNLAWIVAKHVKSNAIILAKDNGIIGIGAGQMSRIDSVEIAIKKAEKAGFDVKGAVLASDAFFPFKDSIEFISSFGIKAVIQPGGSIRDQEVIDSCNEHKISMIFTGERHFRH